MKLRSFDFGCKKCGFNYLHTVDLHEEDPDNMGFKCPNDGEVLYKKFGAPMVITGYKATPTQKGTAKDMKEANRIFMEGIGKGNSLSSDDAKRMDRERQELEGGVQTPNGGLLTKQYPGKENL